MASANKLQEYHELWEKWPAPKCPTPERMERLRAEVAGILQDRREEEMLDLEKRKTELQKQLEALEILEGMDAETRRYMIAALTETAISEDLAQCSTCGEWFKRAGLKRHQTVTHG